MSVAALVEALDALAPASATSVAEIGELLERRAVVLERVLDIDPASLDEADREALHDALARAHALDAALLESMRSARARVAGALDDLVEARNAARGYRGIRRGRGAVLKTA